MTLRIDLPPQIAGRVQTEAERSGLPPEQVVISALSDRFGAGGGNSIGALLAEWEREDATTDASEIAARRAELAEFKSEMNDNRATERKLFS